MARLSVAASSKAMNQSTVSALSNSIVRRSVWCATVRVVRLFVSILRSHSRFSDLCGLRYAFSTEWSFSGTLCRLMLHTSHVAMCIEPSQSIYSLTLLETKTDGMWTNNNITHVPFRKESMCVYVRPCTRLIAEREEWYRTVYRERECSPNYG